jgi:hypothetical protein
MDIIHPEMTYGCGLMVSMSARLKVGMPNKSVCRYKVTKRIQIPYLVMPLELIYMWFS